MQNSHSAAVPRHIPSDIPNDGAKAIFATDTWPSVTSESWFGVAYFFIIRTSIRSTSPSQPHPGFRDQFYVTSNIAGGSGPLCVQPRLHHLHPAQSTRTATSLACSLASIMSAASTSVPKRLE
jgi:hypothetical protein